MSKLQEAISLGLVLGILHGLSQSSRAVPVVPNFSQGSMTSHTETTSKVTETINSIDYNTGWQYSVTGTNIAMARNSGGNDSYCSYYWCHPKTEGMGLKHCPNFFRVLVNNRQ